MSTSPSDGSKPKPKPTGFGSFLKEAIATEHARSHEVTAPAVELPRCTRCGAPRENEAPKCAYCGTER